MGRPSAARRSLAGLPAAGLALAAALAGCGTGAPRKVDTTSSQVDFGIQMAERGLWSEALFRFEKARRDDPQSARALNNLAVSYEALGRFDEALATYRSALDLAPDSRPLRQNYTRFLEFYQSFRPKKPQAAPAEPPAAPTPEDGS